MDFGVARDTHYIITDPILHPPGTSAGMPEKKVCRRCLHFEKHGKWHEFVGCRSKTKWDIRFGPSSFVLTELYLDI